MVDVERDVGRLEARMENVEDELRGIRADVREIRDALVTARGGWFLLTASMSLAAMAGALISTYLPSFLNHGQ
jgi:chromosome condensin MukBEF ATPase and DNA-binding subunit MukB